MTQASSFRFAPGDVVSLWGKDRDLRRIVDRPDRRAYVTADGVYLGRVDVDECGTLVTKANQPSQYYR